MGNRLFSQETLNYVGPLTVLGLFFTGVGYAIHHDVVDRPKQINKEINDRTELFSAFVKQSLQHLSCAGFGSKGGFYTGKVLIWLDDVGALDNVNSVETHGWPRALLHEPEFFKKYRAQTPEEVGLLILGRRREKQLVGHYESGPQAYDLDYQFCMVDITDSTSPYQKFGTNIFIHGKAPPAYYSGGNRISPSDGEYDAEKQLYNWITLNVIVR